MLHKLFIVLALPILSLQWWDVGHMLTAAIAQMRLNQLNPHVSVSFRDLTTSINRLVDNKSQTFIQSACWPDDIKGTKYNMALWNPWHYIDRTYITDGIFPTINFTQVAVNSIQLVNHAIKVISTNINKTTAQRALFARYLVHVVGDMHQPLHSVALFNATYPSGDLGGNRFKIIISNGSSQNFHSYWDAGGFMVQNDSWVLPRPLNLQNLTILKQVALSYIQQYGKQLQQLGKQVNPVNWAIESYKFALNTTYPHLQNSNIADEEYVKLTYQTSKRRITLGGLRLANLAISIWEKAGKNMGDLGESQVNQLWQSYHKQNQKQITTKKSKNKKNKIVMQH